MAGAELGHGSLAEWLVHKLTLPSGFSFDHLFSLQWWLEYLLEAYRQDPGHVLVELFCFAVIIWLLFRKSYDPKKTDQLSKKEEDELIAEWKPDPLTPPFDDKAMRDEVLLVESASEPVTRANGRDYLNFVSNNFLGVANHPEIKEACKQAVEKYGVGSCGPRGFYGTIDVHMFLEDAVAKFYGFEEAILYSDGIACVSSVIPAFAKKGDLIICDEAAHWGIQQGIGLSRSNVLYFKHNDMEDLERVLQDVREKDLIMPKKLTRRFIIVEGISSQHGDICPLDKVVELKKDYKYRLMVDDSLALGVLGATGRGTFEHFGLRASDIDVLCATIDCALAAVGGICVGSRQVVDHQRLSGLGYCFSASSPPYIAVAGRTALEILIREPERVLQLRSKAARLRKAVRAIDGVVLVGQDESPVLHIRLRKSFGSRARDETFLKIVREKMKDAGVVVEVPHYIDSERNMPPPSLRMTVTCNHTEAQIDTAAEKLGAAFESAFEL